jgi:hypothetical protein
VADELLAVGGDVMSDCAHVPNPPCPDCDGTGYAVNCTQTDRERGDLWACLTCCGEGTICAAEEGSDV